MPRTTRVLVAAVFLAALPAVRPAAAATSTCEPDGLQASGAIYRICMPATWNGDLVVFAHGYVGFNEPVAIPEDQLVLPDGTSVPGIINTLGFAFATTSYSTNGLAVVQGIDDVVDLVHIFATTHGAAHRVYLVGPSEGGIVTALAVEKHPDVFAGGLAACGPISVPADVINGFFDTYVPAIQAAIQANPDGVRQLLKVAHAPTDAADPTTVEKTILDLSWYVVFATNDAGHKLGGQPFGNRLRFYVGSDNDSLLNMNVERFTPDLTALAAIQKNYQTSGHLTSPLVTIHTTGDPIIPYWHEPMYTFKTFLAGSATRHINIPIVRYGHCNFKAPEVLVGFAVLIFMVNQQSLTGVEAALPDAASRDEFRSLARQYGAAP